MDPQTVAALVQLGVAGIFLYAFLADKLRTKTQSDERQAETTRLWEARSAEADRRSDELRADRDEWKQLALGTERRLDRALPTVATAIGAPLPSPEPPPREHGL